MPQTLILVDGSSFLYRAYYAAKTDFSTSSGIPTGATLIITNMLRKLITRYPASPIAVVFDAKGKSFRNEIYPEYKANRPHMPEDLVPQVENVQAIVKALGFPLIVQPGVEADDVLGSYAKAAEGDGMSVVICTGDKDLAQLVTDRITLYDSMNDKVYDRNGVIVKYGVPPEHIVDYLALKGDASDNIPGMSKVGDVTAISVINGLGGIAEIEAHRAVIPSLKFRGSKTFADRFMAELDTIKLSYDLATIRTNLDLPIPLAELKPPQPNHQALIEIYTRLEFKKLLAEEERALSAATAAAGAAVGAAAGAAAQMGLNAAVPGTGNPAAQGKVVAAAGTGQVNSVSAGSAHPFAGSLGAARELLPLEAALLAADPSVVVPGTGGQAMQTAPALQAAAAAMQGSGGIYGNGASLPGAALLAGGTGGSASASLSNLSSSSGSTSSADLHLQTFDTAGITFRLVNTRQGLDELCAAIVSAGAFAFDTETDGLQAQACRLIGISFALKPGEAYYLPLRHQYLGCPAQLDPREVKEVLSPLFADPKIKKYGHNLKFDLLVLRFAAGIEVQGVFADSMLAAHLLDSVQRVNLDDLAAKYLNYRTVTFAEVTGGQKRITFDLVEVEKALIYSGEDAEVSLRLCLCLLEQLKAIPELEQLFFNEEMPFMQVLYRMECCGAYVSAEVLSKQNQRLKEELAQVQTDIFTAAGQRFNIASPKQLGQVLFVSMGIPYPKKAKAKGGVYSFSTNEEVLQEIAPHYDIANLVLRYRKLAKLITTYTEKLPTMIDATGRIYTSFNQAGTVTFRLSSSDPNLQNIPARTEEGRLVRKAFIAPPGYCILSADYSQIELRLIAHIARVPNLIKAFQQHQDIHKFTAAEVLGKPIAEVTAAERSHAKATNFGLMYGMTAHGLSRQTGMSHKQSTDYVKAYFNRYPEVLSYMDHIKQEAHAHEYVTTLLGHRIRFAAINGVNARQQSSAERAAINAPMQGSAAEIIKEAMLKIDKWIATLPEESVRMILQVHDELVFEVKKEFADEAAARIKDLMENVVQLEVPLEVGIGIADNWADAH